MANTADFIRGYNAEVLGLRDREADVRSGAVLNVPAGVNAVLFERQTAVLEELFRNASFDTANERFLDICDQRIGERPRVAVLGTGQAVLQIPSGGTGDTLWKGTRIQVVDERLTGKARFVELTEDTDVPADVTSLTVNVTATEVGPSISQMAGFFVDTIYDPGIRVPVVSVSGGFAAETNEEFRSRIAVEDEENRSGYLPLITKACKAAGAYNVIPFDSAIFGEDFGLNLIYVSDSAWESSDALIAACRIAVDSAGVFGTDISVNGITNAPLNIRIRVGAWNFDQQSVPTLKRAVSKAVSTYFESGTNPFLFQHATIRTAAHGAAPGARRVTVTTSLPEPSLATVFGLARIKRYAPNAIDVEVYPDQQ